MDGGISPPFNQFQPAYPPNATPQMIPIFPNQPASQGTSIDWNYITEMNPEMICLTSDIESMNKILNLVVHSDFSSDTFVNQNQNFLQLMKLVQVVMNYMAKCQEELKDQLSKSEDHLEKYKTFAEHAKHRIKKLSALLRLSRIHEKCPSCGRIFKSYEVLNAHMKKRHQQLFPAWISIRRNEVFPPPPQNNAKIQRQINHMKTQIKDLENQNIQTYTAESVPKRFKPAVFHTNQIPLLDISSDESATHEPPINANLPQQSAKPESQQPVIPESQQQQQPVQHQIVRPIPVVQNLQSDYSQAQGNQFEIPSSSHPEKKEQQETFEQAAVKAQAKEFLSQKRRATPILPKTVDEIVHKITKLVHEQSKRISYAQHVEDSPDKVRKEISEDVSDEHPMPNKSKKNNLKDLKNPIKKTDKQKKLKAQQLKKLEEQAMKNKKKKDNEEEEDPEKEKKLKKQQKSSSTSSISHCYGDSMPLTSSHNSSIIMSSDFAEYDSFLPSSSDEDVVINTNYNNKFGETVFTSGYSSQSRSNPKSKGNNKLGQNNQQNTGKGKSQWKAENNTDGSEFESSDYYDEDIPQIQKPKSKDESKQNPPEDEFEEEYEYEYNSDPPEQMEGVFHQNPQPLNSSLQSKRSSTYEDEDEEFDLPPYESSSNKMNRKGSRFSGRK
ncbi:hypothetical protein TRFO_26629 [Tritrichomonas foetus]|uniref:C2H2-type domain-containing protein n=1 Tax=Tritrichomonas foetus TaxID=1144522 RepID=A0A1J4K3L5_9EUKA|nr:hypothetical protein TRFO_26629 [Tritrichomonas foetus]|eukprot:OHT05562.1 hypothetical protein TRFO_26629 [Tritrichomonas foetus]